MELADHFASHVAETRFEDIPEDAVEAARRAILDVPASILAGTTAEGVAPLLELVAGWGNAPEATVAFTPHRVSAIGATWVNGTMARARDIDDIHDALADHPGIAAVVAAVATAEALGDVRGDALMTAVALGADVVLRIKSASLLPAAENPWTTATYAPVGAAVAAGRLLGLDKAKMRHALGIAFTHMANTRQGTRDGSLSHRLQHGIAVGLGLMSAYLARSGVTGPAGAFEGTWGYFNAFEQGRYDPARALADLGRDFRGREVRIKRYPCCAHTHYAVENMIAVRDAHAVDPSEIVSIDVQVNQRGFRSVCDPVAKRQRPKTVVDAQWSLPYVVAVAALHGDVRIQDISEAAIGDEKVLQLAAKVHPVPVGEIDDKGPSVAPCRLAVRLADGRVLESALSSLKGSPENPMSYAEMVEKLEKCAGAASIGISAQTLKRFAEDVQAIETRNVAEVFNRFWTLKA